MVNGDVSIEIMMANHSNLTEEKGQILKRAKTISHILHCDLVVQQIKNPKFIGFRKIAITSLS